MLRLQSAEYQDGVSLNSETGEAGRKMKPKNLIVFDMDGVIIDVSNSYREVVRQTTRQFFSPAKAATSCRSLSSSFPILRLSNRAEG